MYVALFVVNGELPTIVAPIVVGSSEQENKTDSPYLLDVNTPQHNTPLPVNIQEQASNVDIQDITHEMEDDDSLSIEKKEKELIIKALRKNNNRRKNAAKDLGISERTLYRKIKEYEIEE